VSIVTITYLSEAPTPVEGAVFAFEHMFAHRNYFVAMAPLDRFSILPYLLDPFAPPLPGVIEAQDWNLDHQQAHNDAWNVLPSFYGATQQEAGLAIGQNLRDTNFTNPDQVRWWTFANHREHYIANNATFPPPTPPPYWMWPFW
jgi:hypothetical protein